MSLIFANSVNRHTCIDNANDLRQGHDLPISVNDRVFSPGFFFFHETLHRRSFAKFKTLANISKFTVHMQSYPVIGLTFIFIPTLCLPEVKALRYVISLLPYVIRTKLS